LGPKKKLKEKFIKISIKIMAVAFVVFVLINPSCKRVSENELMGKETGNKVLVVATNETAVLPESEKTTPETDIRENFLDSQIATEELEFTSGEKETATFYSTIENEISEERFAFVIQRTKMLKIKDGNLYTEGVLRPGDKLKILRKVFIKGKRFQKEAYYVEDETGRKGYIYENFICGNRLCISVLRYGLIEIYDGVKMEEKRMPQIKFEIKNAYKKDLEELHLIAKFHYKNQEIGKDVANPIAGSLGIDPVKPGEITTAFMRPRDLSVELEEITPENPVVVRLRCSVQFKSYQDCGVYKIDGTHY